MKVLFILSFLFLSHVFLGQTIDPKKFEAEIYTLNNRREFEKSIIRIYEVLDNPKVTYYDQYIAYLQKSYTYKRVYNYTEAFNNLTLALEAGLNTDKVQEVKTKVAIERFFIVFDLQKVDQIKEFVANNKDINLDLIDEKTKGLYIAALAIIDINSQKYDEGNLKIDQALEIFKRVAPQDLPNIYAKRMYLYQKLGNPQKVEEAYDQAVIYAKKYNSPFYIKNLAINMWKYYTDLGNGSKAKEYKEIVDHVNYDDISSFNLTSIRLTELEKKIQFNNQEKAREKDFKKNILLVILTFFATGVLVVFFYALHKAKQKRRDVESENLRMRNTLEEILKENQTKQDESFSIDSTQLTERQKQVIELVKLGKTNKEIANELFISENTVKYHLKIIYNILNIDNRAQLKE